MGLAACLLVKWLPLRVNIYQLEEHVSVPLDTMVAWALKMSL